MQESTKKDIKKMINEIDYEYFRQNNEKFLIIKSINNYKLTMNHSVQQSLLFQGSSEGSEQKKNDFLQDKIKELVDKHHPHLSPDEAFHFQYCKMYIHTIKIQEQVEQLINQIQKLKTMTQKQSCKIKKNFIHHLQNTMSNQEKRKRIRRTANQIARHYVCKVQKCQKSYGSQGSLNQHMKLKHLQLVDGESTP